jgi:hypothetical protein
MTRDEGGGVSYISKAGRAIDLPSIRSQTDGHPRDVEMVRETNGTR